jgi:hypothetical protein
MATVEISTPSNGKHATKATSAHPAKKMLVLPAMPVTAVAKSTSTSIASASVPSLKPAVPKIQQGGLGGLPASGIHLPTSRRLLGKGKKREGASENNAIEIEDSSSSSSDDESVDSDSTEEAGEVRLGHNPLYF